MIEHIVVPNRKLFFMESELTNIQKRSQIKKSFDFLSVLIVIIKFNLILYYTFGRMLPIVEYFCMDSFAMVHKM
jgi:hypothetical protein